MPTNRDNLIDALNNLITQIEDPEATETTIIEKAKAFANALKVMIPDVHVVVSPNAPVIQAVDGEPFVNNDAFQASGLSVLATSALWLDMKVTHTHIPQNLIQTGWLRLLKDNVAALNALHTILVNMNDNRIPAGYQVPSDLTGFWHYFTCEHRLDVLTSTHSSFKSLNLKFLPDRLAFTYHLIIFGETLEHMPAFMKRQLERLLKQRSLQDALTTLPELRHAAAHIARESNTEAWWSFILHNDSSESFRSHIKKAQKAMSLILEKPEYLYDIAVHEKMKPESQARDAIDDRPGWLKHLLLAAHAVTAQTQKTQRAPLPVEPHNQSSEFGAPFKTAFDTILSETNANDNQHHGASFPSIFDASLTSHESIAQNVADRVQPKRLQGTDPGPIQLSIGEAPRNINDTNELVQHLCELFNEVRSKRKDFFATKRSDFVQICSDAEKMLIIILQSFVGEVLPNDTTPLWHKLLRNHFCHFANIYATDATVKSFFENFSTTHIIEAFELSTPAP